MVKKITLTILLLSIAGIFGSCVIQRTIFTTSLMKRYGLGSNDLRTIQFYLAERLVLRLENTNYLRDHNAPHKLWMHGYTLDETVVFSQNTAGRVVYAWYDEDFWGRKTKYNIRVTFEKNENLYLTFSPDAAGVFRLHTTAGGKKVKYAGQNCECLQGGAGNHLLVSHRYFPHLKRRTRTATGNKFLF